MKYLWLFDPDSIIVIPLVSATLWALGGGGMLLLRRIVLPVFIGLSTYSIGMPWYLSAASAAMLMVSTTLAYGSGTKKAWKKGYWLVLLLVGFSWGLSLVPLFLPDRWWLILIAPPLIGASFSALTILSQKDILDWKAVEIAIGFMVGFFVLFSLI